MSNSIDQIPSYHGAIVSKIIELGYAASVDLLGVDSEEMTYRVFGFIDNTIIRTCRPGGGAAARGHFLPFDYHCFNSFDVRLVKLHLFTEM